MTPTEVVLEFVSAINTRHLDKIVGMMTPDHQFTDSLGQVIPGRRAMRDAWMGYLDMVPDYRIDVERSFADGDEVVVVGRAGGTYAKDGCMAPEGRFEIHGAWRARVEKDRIRSWQVYADNASLRTVMRA